jgi:molybdopterin-guanine dinucleotide biosynthesis protein B
MDPVDLVLIEGFKRENHPKIEIFRGANAKPPLHPDDPTIVAIAADAGFDGLTIPRLHLDDIEGIADIVVAHAAPVDGIDWARGDQGT